MHASRRLISARSGSIASALLISITVTSWAQEPALTNAFPTNVFLTDENMLFSYKKGERLVRTKRVQEALRSDESRPAEQDPEGHWGKVVDGFQISLRFEKEEFTNGEPVFATILMRNVSDQRLSYISEKITEEPSPIFVSMWKGEEKLQVKKDANVPNLASTTSVSLYPSTQHKYRVRLNKYYDLSKTGRYSAQAEYGRDAPKGPFPVRGPNQETIASKKATITVTNAAAR